MQTADAVVNVAVVASALMTSGHFIIEIAQVKILVIRVVVDSSDIVQIDRFRWKREARR